MSMFISSPAVVQCDEPVVKNGRLEAGARPLYTFGTSVTLKCNDGYEMDGEDAVTVRCEEDSNWSPRLPTCKRKF